MSARQRRISSIVGIAIYIIGVVLGIWAVASKQGEVSIGSTAWSPDGQRLVVASNHMLYTMDINGRHPVQLSSRYGDYLEPAWSPDGDRIVYMFRPNNAGHYGLWLIDPEDRNVERALPEQPLDEFYPHWSPDGNWLGFYRTREYGGDPSEYGYGYFLLTDFNNVYTQPYEFSITDELEWSPDSEHIAFMGYSGNRNIYSVDTNGTNLQQLTDGYYNSSPAWSPDGRQLAFYSEDDILQSWHGSIYILDIPSQRVERITDAIDRTYRIEWSPNEQKIAFTAYDTSSERMDLFLMNADGTNLQRIDTNIEGLISWSPDGRFLAYPASNYLVVFDTNKNIVVLRYHPRFFEDVLFFLPIAAAEWVALALLLLGPLFTVPSVLIHIPDIRHRYLCAAIRAYIVFLKYTLALALIAGCAAIAYFILSILG
jgi:TolB protein